MSSKSSSLERRPTSHDLYGITEAQLRKGKPLLGALPYFRPDPIKFMMALSRFGDVTETRFGPYKIFLVNNVQGIKHILHTNNKNYLKSPFLDPVKLVLGEGLLTSEGSKWAKDRRIIHQSFQKGNFTLYGEWIAELTRETMEAWAPVVESGEEVDVSRDMMSLTFSVICKSLFSTVNREFVEIVERAIPVLLRFVEYSNNTIVKPPLAVPTKRHRQFKEAMTQMQEISRKIILEHQANPGKYTDLLSLLLETKDPETGEKLSLKDIEDHVITMVLAGHETTAICMTWTWFMVGKEPEVRRRLHEEVDRVLGPGELATAAHLPQLRYATQVIQESMRLYPPAWEFDRIAVSDDVVLAQKIPKGSVVMMCPYLIHRDPRYWKDPLAVRPERFAEENQDAVVPYSYFPFGAGPRACIGKNFAMMEAVLILANIARRFDLEVSPFPEPERETLMTMRPRNGVLVRIRKR